MKRGQMLAFVRILLALLCGLFLLSPTFAQALPDSDSNELAELRQRIEIIEQQNQQLFQQNQYLIQGSSDQTFYGTANQQGLPPASNEVSPLLSPNGGGGCVDGCQNGCYQCSGADPGRSFPITGKWGTGYENNGLWFSSPDKNFRLHVGGRTQWDMAGFQANDHVQLPPSSGGIGPLRDGTDFRRARLRIEGSMYEQMDWCVEYDFVDSTQAAGTPFNIPSPRDLWWSLRDLPIVGNFRAGNQKEPFGFERLESSRFLNLMERSFNTEAFYSPFSAGFSPGFMIRPLMRT